MNVEIDHQRPLDQPLPAQHADRYRDIVEEAEARAVIDEGVVAAPRRVAGEPVLQREAAGKHGAADGRTPAAHQRARERQTQAPNRAAIERERHHRIHIRLVMGQREPRAGRRRGLHEVSRPEITPSSSSTSLIRPNLPMGKRWPGGSGTV